MIFLTTWIVTRMEKIMWLHLFVAWKIVCPLIFKDVHNHQKGAFLSKLESVPDETFVFVMMNSIFKIKNVMKGELKILIN